MSRQITKTYNAPVSIQVYLGSGKEGAQLRENIERRLAPRQSLSEYVVDLLRKAEPALFKGVREARRGE